jgi:hypothetical protein
MYKTFCNDSKLIDMVPTETSSVIYDDDLSLLSSPGLQRLNTAMSRLERRHLRKSRKSKTVNESISNHSSLGERDKIEGNDADDRLSRLLVRNEDQLLSFVAKVNKVYQDLLKRPAPFMTFVFCGMQSSGKSTIMERFLNSVLNIVQQGTGTRCPLDATCIHASECYEPVCELYGDELLEEDHGKSLSIDEVFRRITHHNTMLGEEDRFSTSPLYLVYKSSRVQNMRFVDTPGIISNQSTGKDNREDIKAILRSETRKPNTKLCVLLEPKEYATNPILDFCDKALGGREKWIKNATFLMTKFDKQLDDARTTTKANDFFSEFLDNKCFPHLVITPTLDREDLPPDELFEKRMKLIQVADAYEKDKFEWWFEGHERFDSEIGGDPKPLRFEVQTRIGFDSAKAVMRGIMLKDTEERLPQVIASLRTDLDECNAKRKTLKDRKKFNDPQNLRIIVNRMLYCVQDRILAYLDGDLELSMKFPDKLQTLDEEIEEEDDSNWSTEELNFHTEKEDQWRDRVCKLEEYPPEILSDKKFFGGKQYQRALEFFRVVMIDALPDPCQLHDKVANVTGFLSGGLQQENWERAMVEITRVSLKDVCRPGLNYVIKHVGSIFRRLFSIALEDVKQGGEHSAEYKELPAVLEHFLLSKFDEMLWDLMVNVSLEVHSSMEPMYSSIDPNLPTFLCKRLVSDAENDHYVKRGDQYVPANDDNEAQFTQGWMSSVREKMHVWVNPTSSQTAKEFLRSENRKRSTTKKSFLPDARSSMITAQETDMIINRSFEYIVALMEFNIFVLRFQLNHHLYQGFKKAIKSTLMTKVNDTNWDERVRLDSDIDKQLLALEEQQKGLNDALDEVIRMQRGM